MVRLTQEWRAAGVEQLRLSTVDLTGVPTLENLHRGVDFVLRHREQGSSVYVHCKAGRSRSATLVAAYLIKVTLNALFYVDAVCVSMAMQKSKHMWILA